jgi:hypothetical protein
MPGLGGVEAILDPGETRTITLTFASPAPAYVTFGTRRRRHDRAAFVAP